MGKSKTNEEFVAEVYDLVKDEYLFLEEYKGSGTKIKCRHNSEKCGSHEYKVSPNNFLRGARCPKCSGKMQKTNHEFIKEVYDLVGNEYEFLEPYINSGIKIKCRHNNNECENHEYLITPSAFINGKNRCPKCAGQEKKTIEEVKHEVFEFNKGKIRVLSDKYLNNHTKLKVVCLEHNEIYYSTFNMLTRKNNYVSCPKCQNIRKKEKRLVYTGVKRTVDLSLFSKEDVISKLPKGFIFQDNTEENQTQNKEHILYGIYKDKKIIYIGVTNDFERRKSEHFQKSKINERKKLPLYNSIKKHGKEAFQMYIIHQSNDRDLINCCEYYSIEYASLDMGVKLKNVSSGGDGFLISRDKRKELYKGTFSEWIPCYSININTGEILEFDSQKQASRTLFDKRISIGNIISDKNPALMHDGYTFVDDITKVKEKLNTVRLYYKKYIAINKITGEKTSLGNSVEISKITSLDSQVVTKLGSKGNRNDSGNTPSIPWIIFRFNWYQLQDLENNIKKHMKLQGLELGLKMFRVKECIEDKIITDKFYRTKTEAMNEFLFNKGNIDKALKNNGVLVSKGRTFIMSWGKCCLLNTTIEELKNMEIMDEDLRIDILKYTYKSK